MFPGMIRIFEILTGPCGLTHATRILNTACVHVPRGYILVSSSKCELLYSLLLTHTMLCYAYLCSHTFSCTCNNGPKYLSHKSDALQIGTSGASTKR